MHFCIAVISKEFPSHEVLNKKLEPFNGDNYYDGEEENKQRPLILWDSWRIGGRYCGQIKLGIDRNDEKYDWGFYARVPRAGRLYRSALIEACEQSSKKYAPPGSCFFHFREEDYYPYMGYYDGYLRVDGCLIDDVIDFEKTVMSTFGFIGKDEEVYARDYWDGNDWVKVDDYECKVKEAIADTEKCYITFVDIHA